ncbi:hypothetical protein AQUSIP_01130 [Aquicella siphonis]|uniref:Thioesterase domain-containing protein n=1 Tax=Aquicella siphonis TaxID=254247 RepID=A0A5E4PEQ9_9COXI|nr:thioesterase family protein [Aquicella siphonis]VVC74841.1 hypothetical protein AQUSIP_01130 [Aquicella siphonis]
MGNESSENNPLLQLLSTTFTTIPFNQMLGLQLDRIEAEHVVMNFSMKNELIGNYLYGILHGGVISSVLDMAGGMVVMANSILKNQEKPVAELVGIVGKTSTIDLHINYVNPGRGNLFIAKAWLTKSGKKISFARMELFNEDELLIATGSATYLLK